MRAENRFPLFLIPLYAVRGACGGNRTIRSIVVIEIKGAAINAADDENHPLAGVIGGADDAFLFHALDERRRLVVADRQPPLDIAGRAFFVAQHNGDGTIVEIARLLAFAAARYSLVPRLGLVIDGNRDRK